MSYLEKLPKEDGLCKVIHSIEDKTPYLIEVSCSYDLITGVEQFADWLNAFQEHYNLATGQNHDYKRNDGISIFGMVIPPDKPKIDFSVDSSHECLRFRIGKSDEESRDIVYTFIERLME